MELRHLRYFAAIADTLHYGKAAERLHVSQPALSQQMKQLEEELGVALFDPAQRALHKVALTDAGRAFAADARKILQLSARAIENARAIGTEHEVVRLGYFKVMAHTTMTKLVETLHAAFPALDIKLTELTSNRAVQQALVDGTIDIGFTLLPLTPLHEPHLSVQHVQDSELALILPEQHRCALWDIVPLKELAHERWVMLDNESSVPEIRMSLEAACKTAGFALRSQVTQEVPSMLLIMEFVRKGAGVSVAPAVLAEEQFPGVVFKRFVANTSPREDEPAIIMQLVAAHLNDAPPLVKRLAHLLAAE
jgi:DNA-binding transcriptional LysR family regulator